MTRHNRCSRSPGSSGIQRDDRPAEGPGAPGFDLIPLTLRKTKHILGRRDSKQTCKGRKCRNSALGSLPRVPPGSFSRPYREEKHHATQPRRTAFACLQPDHAGRPARQTCRRQRAACAGARRQPRSPLPCARRKARSSIPARWPSPDSPAPIIPGIEEGLPPGVDPVDETFIDTDARNPARFRRFGPWRSAVRPARLYAAALRGAGQPDRPGLRA